MPGESAKKFSDYSPFGKDQGIDHMAGAGKPGVTVQSAKVLMPSGGVIKFASIGMQDMANAAYQVFIQNHTDGQDAADLPLVSYTTRLVNQFTVIGPDDNDVLDIMVVGTVKGQLSS